MGLRDCVLCYNCIPVLFTRKLITLGMVPFSMPSISKAKDAPPYGGIASDKERRLIPARHPGLGQKRCELHGCPEKRFLRTAYNAVPFTRPSASEAAHQYFTAITPLSTPFGKYT